MGFQLLQIIYWLALAAWFGGALFSILGASVILSTVQENNPILPEVLSVNLDGQHGTLLGSTVVAKLLTAFVKLELVCAAAIAVAMAIEFFLIDLHDRWSLLAALLRTALLLAAAAIQLYEWRVHWPRVLQSRQAYLDHADDPEKANPAMDEFNRQQRDSVLMLEIVIFLLVGLVSISAGFLPRLSTPAAPSPAPSVGGT